MKKLLLFFSVLFLWTQTSFGQLTGTKTIPGDYATISAAITALNGAGVGAGGVTFNIAGDYTETIAAPLSITATGTASNPVIFQKSGAGANPLITAYTTGTGTPGTAVQDGLWNLVGSDYITIDGIDLTDPNATNPATMEYGFGMFKASVSDGCQYNTIKNCVVTLNRLNFASGTAPAVDGSRAINVMNALVSTQTTAVIPTLASGTNSYNMFYTNQLQNCNIGIAIIGYAGTTPFTLCDFGNDIGGSSLATGNNILNFGGGTSATNPSAGVRTLAQYNLNVSYNTINNNNGSGVNHVSTLRGIYLNTAISASATVSHNTLNINSGSTTSQVSVIENVSGATAAGNTINITNNTYSAAYLTATTGIVYGIYSTASAANVNINYNSCNGINYSGAALAGSGVVYAIYNTGAATTLSVSNNAVDAITRTGTTGGNTIGIYASSGTTQTINDNTVSNMSLLGAGTAGFIYGIQATGTTVSVNNNTIHTLTNNKSTGTGALYGIYNFGIPNNENYNNNIVHDLTHNGTGTLYGIYTNTAAGTRTVTGNIIYSISGAGTTIAGLTQTTSSPNIYKNKIYNIQSTSTGAPTVTGILLSSVGSAGTSNIYNNFIGDLKAPSASSTDAIRGIGITATTASSTHSVYYNTIYLNASSTGTNFGSTGIFHSASATATTAVLNLRNNIIVNASTSAGTGLTVAFRRSNASLGNYGATSDNNVFYASNIMYDGTTAYPTLSGYQTLVATRDANSISVEPTFISTTGSDATFLHINTSTATQIESGAVNIATYTDDFDGDIRQGNPSYPVQANGGGTAPDMGADEFDGVPAIPCAGTPAASTISGVDVCSGTGTTLTLNTVYTDLGMTYQWEYSTVSGGPYTNLGTLATQATGNLTETTYYICSITCTNSSEFVTTDEFIVTVKPVPTASASSNSPICAGATLELTGITDIGTTFAWTGPNSFTSSDQNPQITSSTTAASGSYSFIASLNGCSSTSATTSASVNPVPEAIIITPSSASVSYATVQQLDASGGILTNGTILSEDFNGATNDWTTINNSINGTPANAAWTLQPNGYVYTGVSPATFNSNDNSQFYLSNSDAQGSSSTTATILQSPVLSTLNFTSASINFYHYYRHFGSAKVEASTDGTNWTTLQTYSSTQGAMTAFVSATVNLTASFLNQATVYIRFKYDASWGYYWGIDNVRIIGTGPAPITWTPITDLYTDAAATTAYAGEALTTVYSKPLATRTYTATGTTLQGCTNSTDVTVTVYPAVSFTLTGPSSVTAGNNSTNFTIQVFDVLGNPTVCDESTCFSLTTTSTGQDAGFSTSSPCIAINSGSATFTYTDSKIGTFNITATFSSGESGLTGQSHSLPITVNILPWLQANISTANGSTEFFPSINAGTFEFTATGLSAPKNDVHNFVYQQLCGTGTVIARLANVQNGGWAGVEMRESNAPGSKVILFKTKLTSPSVIIGYRNATNANMVNISQNVPSIHWMKIQRNGNTFSVYVSYNSTSWTKRYSTNISMSNCINAGFFTESISNSRTVTSWFDHAEVVNFLKSGEEISPVTSKDELSDIEFYPNPASDQITIVAPNNESNIRVLVFDAAGILVESDQFNATEALFNIQNLKSGVYLLRFEKEGIIVNKRLVVL
ncbi:MAG: T9SS type A sorting domain-containing protein [Bacteroidales bacterium]|nr:T9SS type A sorting domain-containing protein [Bacteroidales bacterium]